VPNNIHPSTHTWSSRGFKLKPCIAPKCKAVTTGRVKNSRTKKELALCSRCAAKKGF